MLALYYSVYELIVAVTVALKNEWIKMGVPSVARLIIIVDK